MTRQRSQRGGLFARRLISHHVDRPRRGTAEAVLGRESRRFFCGALLLSLLGPAAPLPAQSEGLPAQSERLAGQAQGPRAPQADAALLLAAERVVEQAIERAAPSVVAIARFRKDEGRDVANQLNFNLPGLAIDRESPWDEGAVPTEFAAGVIISGEGHILTCYHVVDDPQQNSYYVWLDPEARDDGGEPVPARVVRQPAEVLAGDPWTDLAVLKIEAEGLPVMPMGDAQSLRRGSFVVALGNPYAVARDGRASASFGIVANLQRRAAPAPEESNSLGLPESLQEFGTLIQTDAKLNLGTSGGALINTRGEMIGLTTSLAAVAGFEQAAGYAIAIDPPAQAAIGQLREGRAPAFGFLGVEPIDAPDGGGAMVRSVVPGMAAEEAGLRPGEVITAVANQPIRNASDLFREMSRRPADSQVAMTVRKMRGAEARQVVVRLGKKRLALARPGFSVVREPSWRGMTVDFASALPPGRLLNSNIGKQGDAAVVRVDPDSPAWNAGVRPGRLVLSAAGKPVTRPDEFYQAVEGAEGEVPLILSGRFAAPQRVRVAE